MNKLHIILTISLLTYSQLNFARKTKTNTNILGHVVYQERHVPFVSISVKGTTIGTSTDESGHYQLNNLPEGELIIVV